MKAVWAVVLLCLMFKGEAARAETEGEAASEAPAASADWGPIYTGCKRKHIGRPARYTVVRSFFLTTGLGHHLVCAKIEEKRMYCLKKLFGKFLISENGPDCSKKALSRIAQGS